MNVYSQVVYVRTRAEAAAVAAEIEELRVRCGQQEDLSTDLNHLFSMYNPELRRPLLVLLREGDQLRAAVFFLERLFFGIGTGFYRVGDQTGDASVIALPGEREYALQHAMDLLMTRWSVHTIAGALSESDGGGPWPARAGRVLTQTVVRQVQRRLPILENYERTLSQLSGHMRKKVRASRRKAEERLDLQFVPELSLEMAREAFTSLATKSLPSRSSTEVEERCNFMAKFPQAFCSGLRLRSGEWIALASGWRAGASTCVSWQVHNLEYKAHSLNYVFSAFLLEQESNRQQKELVWIGGTNARWQAFCKPESCLYLLRRRSGVRPALLKLLANFILLDSCYHICEQPADAELNPQDEIPGWKRLPGMSFVLGVLAGSPAGHAATRGLVAAMPSGSPDDKHDLLLKASNRSKERGEPGQKAGVVSF